MTRGRIKRLSVACPTTTYRKEKKTTQMSSSFRNNIAEERQYATQRVRYTTQDYMACRRIAILIPPEEREILWQLYRENGFASDQYRRRPRELDRLTNAWNGLTNRTDSPGELLHYIITQRKQKKWFKFSGTHQRLHALPEDFLSNREWSILRTIYEELIPLKLGSDNLAYDDVLSRNLSREFHDRAGRVVHGCLLFAAIMQRRKRGEWVRLPRSREASPGEGLMRPFGDIDLVAG